MGAIKKILLLPGDGIGPEVINEVQKIIDFLVAANILNLEVTSADIGGASIDIHGEPLTDEVVGVAKAADAILLGAVGGPKWDSLEAEIRPEKGLLKIRKELDLFANLRPAILNPALADASSLKPELIAGLDILIVRELTGGIYFGSPRGVKMVQGANNKQIKEGFNTYKYNEDEVVRIGRVAFEAANIRGKKLCSVDKANVLEGSMLWREVMNDLAADYPDVQLTHMYVDNAAMQLVKDPKSFDVIVTGNMFGDILSDLASMLTGSIGMLPSASLNATSKGLYEPVHGSAPDIAGLNCANPLAMILSFAMALRFSLEDPVLADKLEKAVDEVLINGFRTSEISYNYPSQSTSSMGDLVLDEFQKLINNKK